jgi:phospholipid/cholesterol/gamma-HCH transport system ATP-binding protein
MNKAPLICFEKVAISFGKHAVHKGISFNLYPGEVLSLLGPSGTGKTVLLKLAIGLLMPTQGSVSIFGKDLARTTSEELNNLRRRIGMLFQGAALFDSMTVYDNIAFALRELKTIAEAKIRETVLEKLELVDLVETEKKFPGELSGGQKKRIGLARALATSPSVLLFDEPTTGLDPTSKSLIDSLIINLRANHGISSIVVTHDMDSARKISDRLVLIAEGSVLVDDKATLLWDQNPLIKRFSQGLWD